MSGCCRLIHRFMPCLYVYLCLCLCVCLCICSCIFMYMPVCLFLFALLLASTAMKKEKTHEYLTRLTNRFVSSNWRKFISIMGHYQNRKPPANIALQNHAVVFGRLRSGNGPNTPSEFQSV